MRHIVSAMALLVAAAFATPAAAQTVGGCASVPSNRVATTTDATKLKADNACLERAIDIAKSRIAERVARLAVLSAPPAPPKPTAKQPAKIPTNLNTAALVQPAWGTGDIPASAKPDNVGAFRFICRPGAIKAIDPIVYPGTVGDTHEHQLFGNVEVNENSTYESLRASGDSTCNNALNRSAYWTPAMLNGRGSYVIPDYASFYYKRFPAGSPECAKQGIMCVNLPRGLRYVFGRNMLDHKDPPTGAPYWNCQGPTATPGHYKDIVEAAPNCPTGNQLGMIIISPDCWNGVDLDSDDHRKHMAYATYVESGALRCPTTHPYVVPQFTQGVWYTVDDTLDRSGKWEPGLVTWSLTADSMPGMKPERPGSFVHADWFGAWDDDTADAWQANCIDKLLNCSGGDLGNGKQMTTGPLGNRTFLANPRLVPVPTR